MRAGFSRLLHTCIAIWIATLGFASPAIAQTADRPLFVNENGLPTLAPLLQVVTPAVVNVSVESRETLALNPLFNDPFLNASSIGNLCPNSHSNAAV